MREKTSEFFFIPKFMIIPLAVSFIWNVITYYGTRMITKDWQHINPEIFIDGKIPFLPWTVSIYLGCYLFWAINYILAVRQDRKEAIRLMAADFFAKTVCFILFILIPTTNIRPEVTGGSIWDSLMRFVYNVDVADNLFPSIHCLTSWFCYIGVRKNPEIPKPYVMFSLVFAICIFISTLTTKQHAVVDVAGGALLAELSYFLVKFGFAGIYEKFMVKINGKFGIE